jgi:hypothetical protein
MLQHATTHQIQKPTEPLWTQEEAIAFECAKETVGHMIAICSSLIAKEEMKSPKSEQRIMELEAKSSKFTAERRSLRLKDKVEVERINREYGSKIKAYLKDNGACPV